MDIAGKHALVTGANRGLGLHLVQELLARGADRVYAAARNPDTLAGVVAKADGRVIPVCLDVTDADQVASVAADLADVRLLVSNAGQACAMPVLGPQDITPFRSVFEVNFFGPLTLARSFAPQLRDGQGGAILFIQSLAALVISRSSPLYSASKAAAMMMAAGLRSELRSDDVTVTCSYPGFIDTDMTTGADISKATPQSVAKRSLDGLEAGAAAVFPDGLAELVEQALHTDMERVLTDPQAVMTELIGQYQAAEETR
jgi:NAD(P)-dependent dehydrogenase (short-subunit alcohol dehydrogenase family)